MVSGFADVFAITQLITSTAEAISTISNVVEYRLGCGHMGDTIV